MGAYFVSKRAVTVLIPTSFSTFSGSVLAAAVHRHLRVQAGRDLQHHFPQRGPVQELPPSDDQARSWPLVRGLLARGVRGKAVALIINAIRR